MNTKTFNATLLARLPRHILTDLILPAIEDVPSLIEFIRACSSHPILSRIISEWWLRTDSCQATVEKWILNTELYQLPVLLEKLQKSKQTGLNDALHEANQIAFYFAGILLNRLFCVNVKSSHRRMQWNIYHLDRLGVQRELAEFMSNRDTINVYYFADLNLMGPIGSDAKKACQIFHSCRPNDY